MVISLLAVALWYLFQGIIFNIYNESRKERSSAHPIDTYSLSIASKEIQTKLN